MSGKSAKTRRTQTRPPDTRSAPSRARLLASTAGIVVVAIAALYFLSNSHNSGSGANGSSGSDYPYAVGSPGPGAPAPNVALPATTGGTFDLAGYRGKERVLLYFQEGLTCQPCWDQIAAIQKDRAKFSSLGIGPIVSITTDSLDQIRQKARDDGLTIPVLSDSSGAVSDSYSARDFGMMGHDRDGHTFVLVGKDGKIVWRADYGGAPKYTMFVPDDQLLAQLRKAVGRSA
ncbi:MAG: peroxiredoxin family protein [Gaiellaceae bacterium]